MASVDNLIAARDSLAAIIAAKTSDWESAGCPATYSIDGVSVQWGTWLGEKTQQLQLLNQTIQAMQPFMRVSRGY